MTEFNPHYEVKADYFDGHTAVAQRIRLDIGRGVLILRKMDGETIGEWPFGRIRAARDQASKTELVLFQREDTLERIRATDASFRHKIAKACPTLYKRQRFQGRKRLLKWSLAAVGSVALIITVLIPLLANQMAELLPIEGEIALGDATFEQIQEALTNNNFLPVMTCFSPEGREALEKMTARLMVGTDLPYPLKVEVLNHPMVNAFALPGGRVVLMRGLLRDAESPEEVAAVLAHEIGHVAHRDPTRGALRTAGSVGVLGLLIGDFAGGTAVLLLTEQLINASYSREAEARADAFASEMLSRAGLPPTALAIFFDRLLNDYGDQEGLVAHFSSHPALADRAAAARLADQGVGTGFTPVLDDAEWKALGEICG